jgi:hypothetical protein
VLSVGHILIVVRIGVLALGFLQLFLKSFQVECSLLLGRLFLLFQLGKVKILRGTNGRRRYVGRWSGCTRAIIALRQGVNIDRWRQEI